MSIKHTLWNLEYEQYYWAKQQLAIVEGESYLRYAKNIRSILQSLETIAYTERDREQ